MDLEPIAPTSPPKPPYQYILALCTLLLLACVGFLIYQNIQLKQQITDLSKTPTRVITPTPAPIESGTANWKIYTNHELGFSFRYPNNLAYIYDGVPGKNEGQPLTLFRVTIQNFDGMKSKGKSDSDFQFNLSVQTDKFKTLNEYIPTNIPESSKSLTTINNKEAIKVVDDHYANWPIIWAKSGDYVYIFQLSNSGNKYRQYFDQILSTFTFNKPQTTQTGTTCGGLVGKKCPTGETCKITSNYPDAMGTCAKSTLTCPSNGWVDCEPSPNAGIRYECTPEAMNWYKENCPNFQGGAL